MTDELLGVLRRQAFGIAYRMSGSVSDAEDVAQEVVLRLVTSPESPREPGAWVTTVATRLSIDALRRAKARRRAYVGPWLPDPLLDVPDPSPGPQERVELADSLSQAFLVLLEQLTPLERAAFLLREVFGEDYASIARTLDGTEGSCRQLVSRARARVRADRPRFDADPAQGRALLERFLSATEGGELHELEQLLTADVVLYGDGGGTAASPREPLHGAPVVAAFLLEISRKRRALGSFDLQLATVNGQPGRVLRTSGGEVWDVLTIDVHDGQVAAVRIIRNPEKISHLSAVTG